MTLSANPARVGLIAIFLLLVIAATCRPGPSSERYAPYRRRS
jgi:hypothetical protein